MDPSVICQDSGLLQQYHNSGDSKTFDQNNKCLELYNKEIWFMNKHFIKNFCLLSFFCFLLSYYLYIDFLYLYLYTYIYIHTTYVQPMNVYFLLARVKCVLHLRSFCLTDFFKGLRSLLFTFIVSICFIFYIHFQTK